MTCSLVRGQAPIRYVRPDRQDLRIALYDVLGQQVRTVVSDQKEGRHERTLDVSGLPSGVYVLRLEAEGEIRTQKGPVVR